MSSRANIPARRPVSTISPATAFCNSFAPGNGGKISRQVHRAAGSRQRLLHSLCPRQIRQRQARRGTQPDRGIGIALRREPDHRRQHRRAAGQGGKTAGAAQRRFAARTPRCQGNTGPSARGRWPPSGWFSPRQRPGSKGADIAIGSVCTGPGTTISPSSVRSTSAEWAVRPQTIAPLPLSNRAAAIVVADGAGNQLAQP
ncbi:Uncharacterised protein [Klebsiella pneumoniae]|uniref:Uncharacterized protein n=1 Tax=Klebsiella pneumoniae TaxID=573 RepID=A0A377W4R9_KLEPN|nr:Uncharacterised protein [Klebsiella pneumoniae]